MNLNSVPNDERLTSEHLKKLVENGHISEARTLLSTIQFGRSFELDNWKRVLAEPDARKNESATGGEIKRCTSWLNKNSSNQKYRGKWVALKNGLLIDSHKSRVVLRNKVKQKGELSGVMFFRS